jgi:hypothetical protein
MYHCAASRTNSSSSLPIERTILVLVQRSTTSPLTELNNPHFVPTVTQTNPFSTQPRLTYVSFVLC